MKKINIVSIIAGIFIIGLFCGAFPNCVETPSIPIKSVNPLKTLPVKVPKSNPFAGMSYDDQYILIRWYLEKGNADWNKNLFPVNPVNDSTLVFNAASSALTIAALAAVVLLDLPNIPEQYDVVDVDYSVPDMRTLATYDEVKTNIAYTSAASPLAKKEDSAINLVWKPFIFGIIKIQIIRELLL